MASNRVEVEIVEVDDIEDEETGEPRRTGVRATCSECGQVTESFGTGTASRRRCLALMRDCCEETDENYYVDSNPPPARSTT